MDSRDNRKLAEEKVWADH